MVRACFISLLAWLSFVSMTGASRIAWGIDTLAPAAARAEPEVVELAEATVLFQEASEPLPLPPAPEISSESTAVPSPASTTLGDPAAAPLMEALSGSADDCWSPGMEGALDGSEEEGWFRSRDSLFSYTLIPAGSEEVSFNRFEIQHVLAARHIPRLLVTPRFAVNFVGNDPVTEPLPGLNLTDIPGQLYEVAVDATLVLPIGERWSVQGSIAPSLFTDFVNTSAGAFRLPSKLVGYYQWSEAATIAAGIAYLDREDISTVGYLGVILGIPGEEWKVEILFPRSRIAYRVKKNGQSEHWIYFAQDYIGGASWGMRHSYGLDDVVTYRDERISLGYEWIVNGRNRGFVEGGYVYDRELDFRYLGRGCLSSTGIFRCGLTF